MKRVFLLTGLAIVCEALAVTVVLPEKASLFERKAADELVLHIDKATGSKSVIVTEGQNGAAPRLYVGNTAFAKANGVDFSGFGVEEWQLKSVGNDVIVGGGTPRGVLYGAFEFLERVYGVLWLDEYTTVFTNGSASFPKEIDVKGRPDFNLRSVYAYFHDKHEGRRVYQFRNRMNFFQDETILQFGEPYGITQTYGSPGPAHTYHAYSKNWPPEDDDCFSLLNGKRVRSKTGSGPGQLCLSNPKTVKNVAKRLREFIEEDRQKYKMPPKLYDISQNDNDAICQCEGCQALIKKYGTYGGLTLHFMNAVGEEIEKDYPEIRIQTFSYMNTMKPPKGIKARDNVIVRIAQLGTEWGKIGPRDTLRPLSAPTNAACLENILEWSKLANISIWDYWVIYRGSGFAMCYEAIPENLRFYKGHNVSNIFVEHEGPMGWPFYAFRIWLGYRFLNNVNLDLETQTRLFFKYYYGEKAAPVMREYMDYIIKRNNEVTGFLGKITLKKRTDLDDAFFAKGTELVEKALALAEDDAQRKHILRERFVLFNENKRKNGKNITGIEAYLDRIVADYKLVAPDWVGGGTRNKTLKDFEAFRQGLTLKVEPPKELAGREIVHDICWPDMSDNNGSKITDMPDAAGGKALCYVEKDPNYRATIHFGFYDADKSLQAPTIVLTRDKTPTDEKFHLYKIGRVTLSAHSYLWTQPSWFIQRPLDEFYEPMSDELNTYDAYISIKVEGPVYVDGSTKQSAFSCDRMLLVKPQ